MTDAKPPTNAELEILRILWRSGPATVRSVLDQLERPAGYTTVLKHLQIMTEKQLVDRRKEGATHLYWATSSEESTQRRLVRDLMRRAFPDSAQRLVLQALTEKPASREELAEIRDLIQELESEAEE